MDARLEYDASARNERYSTMAIVSEQDKELLRLGRAHITGFLQRMAGQLAREKGRCLEVGPQDWLGARQLLHNYSVETFDIVDTYGPTHVGDITRRNDFLADDAFDCVVCMDVLEHTLDPFGAVQEIRRVLRHGGYLLVSAPLNFRIHGPIPDCWRFTEHGMKVLLRDFDLLELDILETPGRDLFPAHYNVLARNDKSRTRSNSELKFRFID
jgi:SAM-dependent methyltransferase